MVNAYCESPKITEESFLLREFGIKTVYVNSTEDFLKKLENSGGDTIVIVSTNPIFWKPNINQTYLVFTIFMT